VARTPIEFTCPSCRKSFESTDWGTVFPCPECGEGVQRIAQLDQLLDQWFYPRRWRADLHEPNPYYLLEKLWTANGQGETLYTGIAPAHANYDVFRHLVTRLVAQGVDEGWVELEFPDDPLEENPVYQLKFGDPDRFARGVERLFPEVDWDEQIEVPASAESSDSLMPDVTTSVATADAEQPTSIASARSARRGRRRR
jgi:predicted RNA-binding Zn-ribbon protein involved in translation (DUF1610 family)